MLADPLVNKNLDRKNVGITKGGQIVRKWQTVAYAVPVSLALAYNVHVALNSPAQPQNDRDDMNTEHIEELGINAFYDEQMYSIT